MKSFLFFLFFLFTSFFSEAQNVFEKKYITGLGGALDAPSMCVTPDGGFTIIGETSVNSAGLIFHIDSAGNIVWKKKYDHVFLMDIISTHDHGFAICGWSYYNVADKMVVIKTDSVGNVTWSRFLGSYGQQLLSFSIKETANDNLILYGVGDRYATDDTSYLICVDSSGNQLWSHAYSDQRLGRSGEVIACKDKGFLFTEAIRIYGDTANMGNEDFIYVVKTDSLGNITWGGTITDSTRMPGFGMAVRETFDHGFLIAAMAGFSSDSNLLLIRMDTVGHILWTKRCDFGFGMNGIENISMDTSPNNKFIISINLNLQHGSYMIEVDNLGNIDWAKSYGTPNEQIRKVVCLPNGYAASGIMDTGATHSIYFVRTDTAGVTGCEQIISHTSTDLFMIMDTVKTNYPGIPDSAFAVQSSFINLNSTNICGSAGINQFIEEKILAISPNPSSGTFTISSSSPIQSIEVFDLMGNIIFENKLNSRETNLDLSFQSQGIYFVKVTDEKGIAEIRKIILQ